MKTARSITLVLAVGLAALALVSDPGSVGPQATIGCDAGAVMIAPGDNVPNAVWNAGAGASICLKAGGVHQPTIPINVKTGQRLICEYGAVLDGSAVYQSYDPGSSAIIRGQGPITDVVVQNCVIRNAPLSAIFAYNGTDRWTIDHNEITANTYGVNLGYNDGVRVTNNRIHHNNNLARPDYTGGYGVNASSNLLFENNALSYNGRTQKVTLTTGTIFRGNTFDHEGNAIWYDGDNTNSLIENNLIEDSAETGIFYEISGSGIIRNNTIRRAGQQGIFLSTSRDVEVSGNTVDDAWRGIQMFVGCDRVYGADAPYPGAIGWDLRNNAVHDNRVAISTQAGSLAAGMSQTACSTDQLLAYTNGSKGLTFANNRYGASDLSPAFWFWGNAFLRWGEWQAIPQDATGTFGTDAGTPVPPPVVSDTTAPDVAVVEPVNGATLARKSRVSVRAIAADDVGVARVDLFVNGSRLCSVVSGTYACVWNVPASRRTRYTLTAQAVDAAGNVGTSAAVVVTVQ